MKMEPTNLLDSTPKVQRKKQRIRKTPFAGLSARKKLKRCLTPPRNTFGSHMSSRTSSAASATLSNAFTTSYDGVNDYRLTSTEHEPAPFQVELPAKKEILVHSKICALMDGYTAVHRDFNFAMLSGVSRPTLQKEVDRSTKDKPMIAGSCHRDVVKQILECAEDLVVEGFFREYTDEEKDAEKSERMEACIFSSESLRQIIVCFRGSTANQAKPLRNTLFGKQGEEHITIRLNIVSLSLLVNHIADTSYCFTFTLIYSLRIVHPTRRAKGTRNQHLPIRVLWHVP